MSDGSFPHTQPQPDDARSVDREHEGARVLDFPTEEVSSPGQPVPAGTWADDGEGEGEDPRNGGAAESTERLVRSVRPAGDAEQAAEQLSEQVRGRVVKFPLPSGTRKRRRPSPLRSEGRLSEGRLRDVSGTQRTQEGAAPAAAEDATELAEAAAAEPVEATEPGPAEGRAEEPAEELAEELAEEEATPPRPAFLASELLQQDWWPRAPLRRTLRWGTVAVAGLGAVGALAIASGRPEGLGLALLFGLCAIAGGAPVRPELRGMALGVVAGAGASWVAWLRAVDEGALGAPLLVACTTLSASALFFRAAHRTSRLARVLAGVGLAATASWLVLTGGLDALVVETMDFGAWVGPVSRVVLILVLLGACLSFLDPTGHGGAWVAGAALLVWLGLDAVATVTSTATVAPSARTDISWLATFSLPLFCAIAAAALCQLWTMVSRAKVSRARGAG